MTHKLEDQQIGEEFWISISDLMSGLMVVFMFIAVAYITNMAVTYDDLQNDLYEDLLEEFKDDLDGWGAMLDRETLSVRFQEPDVLFDAGQHYLKSEFRAILDDFFPRYIDVLTREKYLSEIEEVRIEGHTSSEWEVDVSGLSAYVLNMELSQDRTRSVLGYTLSLPAVADHSEWLIEKFTANGLSSSHLVYAANGQEDRQRSRRVEFRVKTNAESRILALIATNKQTRKQ